MFSAPHFSSFVFFFVVRETPSSLQEKKSVIQTSLSSFQTRGTLTWSNSSLGSNIVAKTWIFLNESVAESVPLISVTLTSVQRPFHRYFSRHTQSMSRMRAALPCTSSSSWIFFLSWWSRDEGSGEKKGSGKEEGKRKGRGRRGRKRERIKPDREEKRQEFVSLFSSSCCESRGVSRKRERESLSTVINHCRRRFSWIQWRRREREREYPSVFASVSGFVEKLRPREAVSCLREELDRHRSLQRTFDDESKKEKLFPSNSPQY